MHDQLDRHYRMLARLLFVGALAMMLAACSAAGGSGGSPGASGPSASPAMSSDPDTPVGSSPGSGAIVEPPPGGDLVVPKPGQLDVKPIRADTLTATVDGRHVVLTIGWTSGVEPCYVLDSIVVDRDGHAITVTLREGHGPEEIMCIQIAQAHRTQVDLGELEPGAWTIADSQGGASPIEVVIS
jgi:hypothetical protein